MRTAVVLAFAMVVLLSSAGAASADDGWRFRLTTPRGELIAERDALLLAIPGGRAWGITSGPLGMPLGGGTVSAEIEVRDAHVREAFIRAAYYGRGRPRQILVQDSAPVRAGERARVSLSLDPPVGAIAFRVRFLARLLAGIPASEPGAIAIREVAIPAGPLPIQARRTRLVAAR